MKKPRFLSYVCLLSIGLNCEITRAGFPGSEVPSFDQQVQAPTLEPTKRGSLIGELSSFSHDGTDAMKGAFSFALPLIFPEDRGRLIYPIAPNYSITQGLSEWGLGFTSTLSITRFRRQGFVSYTEEDQFSSPWGTLIQGEKGYYYPEGMQTAVRLQRIDDTQWVAYLSNGDRLFFGGENAQIRTGRGTYSWYLSSAESLSGERALYQYKTESSRDSVGRERPILDTVYYGGHQDRFQYQIQIESKPLRIPFFDYHSGERISLSRRIERVSLNVRLRDGFTERYSYLFRYGESDFSLGSYLRGIKKRYASGGEEPEFKLEYHLSEEVLQKSKWQPVRGFDSILKAFPNALLPNYHSVFSLEEDGTSQIEIANSYQKIAFKEGEYQIQDLPQVDPALIDPICRKRGDDPMISPRLHTRLRGKGSLLEVVGFERVSSNQRLLPSTVMHVCDDLGRLKQKITFNEVDLRPSSFSKLVDLSQNGKPDLVQITRGAAKGSNFVEGEIRINVYQNLSSQDEVAFREPFTISLKGHLDQEKSYALFQDLNGDGILDFILVKEGEIQVWYGKGNYEFEPQGRMMPFRIGPRMNTTGLYQSSLIFQDLNGDGVPDVIVNRNKRSAIYLNRGSEFIYQEGGSPLARLPYQISGRPVFFDLLGTGNPQVVSVDLMQNSAYAMELGEPGTRLLRSINDGKGNQVEFSYKRIEPSPWIAQRFAVMDQVRMTVAGEGSRLEEYDYSHPSLHSLDKGFLGFSQVAKRDLLGGARFQFQYGDQQPGILLKKEEWDHRFPDLFRFFTQVHETTTALGFPWLKLVLTEKGFKKAHGSSTSLTTSFKSQLEGICPSEVFSTDFQGTTQYSMNYFQSPLLERSLHCTLESFQVRGFHSTREFNFQEGLKVQRNEIGQPIEISRLGTVSRVLQKIEYNQDYQVTSVFSPQSGKTTFQYDPETTLLQSILQSNGVQIAVQRDLIHDQVQELSEDRGNTKKWTRKFEFDELERLKKSWEVFSSDPTQRSVREFNYAYATQTTPGWIEVLQKIEGQSRPHREADLMSGSGKELAKLVDLGTIGVLGKIQSHNSAQRVTQTYSAKNLNYPAFLQNPDFDLFYEKLIVLSEKKTTTLDLDFSESQLYQAGILGQKEMSYDVSQNRLIKRLIENEKIQWFTEQDVQGRLLSLSMPDGKRFQYERDVLGRLQRIKLPAGEEHQIQYNDLGEIAQIRRTGLGDIRYSYQPKAGLLEKKEYLGQDGKLMRSVQWAYDEQGRKTQTRFQSGVVYEDYHYFYDGNLGTGVTLPGQKGRLSSIVGPTYQTLWNYREDGKVLSEEIKIPEFGSLMSQYQYGHQGFLKQKTVERKDVKGASILKLSFRYELDEAGRESKVFLNNHLLYQLQYDSLSRVSSIQGEELSYDFDFDGQTQKTKSFTQHYSSSQDLHLSWNLGNRGLVENERYSIQSKTVDHSYQYNDSGFLTEVLGEKGKTFYHYDDHQMVELTNDIKEEGKWKTSQGHYTLDPLGRVVEKNLPGEQVFMSYGPQGRVSQVFQIPRMSVSYSYDHDGKRIFKKRGTRIEEVYLGEMVLTPTSILIPITVQGRMIGYLENSEIRTFSSDTRNSIVSDDGHSLQIPSPYGERQERDSSSSRSRLVDYALLGYDGDLKAYRAQQRDYDPAVKRFLTPDPLFLESPEKCVESPVECNLYGYAKGNPVSFVDPTGRWATEVHHLLIELAFPQASRGAIEAMKGGSNIVDGLPAQLSNSFTGKIADSMFAGFGQLVPGFAYQHSMRDFWESPAAASIKSESFVQQNFADAKLLMSMNLEGPAFTALGKAIHTLTDSTSPVHQGQQVWAPYTLGAVLYSVVRHGDVWTSSENLGSFFSSSEMIDGTVHLMRNTIKTYVPDLFSPSCSK